MLLKAFDVAADGRLAQMDGVRCVGKALQLNDFAENLKLP
jgi:hypothetical protein